MFLPWFTPGWGLQRVCGVIPALLIEVSHRKYMELDHSLHTSSSKQIEVQHSDDFFRLHHAIFNWITTQTPSLWIFDEIHDIETDSLSNFCCLQVSIRRIHSPECIDFLIMSIYYIILQIPGPNNLSEFSSAASENPDVATVRSNFHQASVYDVLKEEAAKSHHPRIRTQKPHTGNKVH